MPASTASGYTEQFSSAAAVRAAEKDWEKHLDNTWYGGLAKPVHSGARMLKKAAVTAAIASAPIPVVGQLCEGFEIPVALGAGFMPGAYTYDARNRLLSAGGISYAYDAENRRIAQTDTSGTTHYAINPNAPLDQVLVRTAPGGTKTYYVYGLGLLHEETGSTVRYYHCDRRGDTVLLTDASGGVTDRASYGVFGDLVSRSGTTDTPFLFNGCYGVQTDANGLYYLRARYYHPALRRFLNQDSVLGSIASAMSLNRYAYANGNPVTEIDPFGTMAQDLDPNGRLTISEILSAIWSGAKEGLYNATIGSAVNAGTEAGQMYIDAREGGSGVLAALGLAVSQGLGRETGGLGLLEFYSGEQIGIGADGSLEASEFDSVSAWALHGGASYAQAFTTATGITALGEKLMAAETIPHKNSLNYVGETHVYRVKGPDGTTYKIGESAQGVRVSDGASIRAEQQARRLTRETGDVYTTEIRKTFPDKASARKYETNLIERFRRLYGDDTLPGNKTNR